MSENNRAPEGDRSHAAVAPRWDMSLAHAMETQRAVRRVLPDPVDDAIVLRCVELALRAPTGSNGQNWEFIVIKDPAVKAAFADQYRTAWAGYGGGSLDPRIADAVTWQVDHFEEIPVMVLACLADDGRGAPGPDDPPVQHSSFYGSIYPSVQNLLLAARSVGLGASLITLPLWSRSATRQIVGLPGSVTPVCLVPLGWPRGRYGPTTRRPVGDVVHLDRFGNRPWAAPTT